MASASATIPVGYKQTEVGVIPADWMVKPIGEVAEVVGGGTPSTQVPKYWGGDINWLTPTEVGSGKYVSDSNRKLTNSGLQNSSASMLPKGTILLTSRAGIGDLGILESPACTNQGFQSLICSDNVDHEFLYYVMLTKRSELERKGSGSTFLEITPSEVKSLLIALPGLKEQYMISEVLSDSDSQIHNLEKLISKKRDIKQGTMQELLTGKTRLPGFSDEWIKTTLGDVCSSITDGTHYTPKYVEFGIPFYSVENVTQNNFDDTKYISQKEHNQLTRRCKPERGDILLTRIGSLGKTKLINWDVDASIYVSLALLKPRHEIYSDFLYAYTQSSQFVIDLENRSLLNASPKKINMNEINEIPIKLPPTEKEQYAISTIILDMEAEISALELLLEKTKAIKQGMMQQLLTGRIRLVDPNTSTEASA